jgi:hypothetical protein
MTITGKGSISVGKDLEAILRKIEYWHQAPVTKFRIRARQGQGTWHAVRWDGKTAISFPLDERDEAKAMQALLLQHPFEEAANPSDREIDTNDVMSDQDKNRFIEQHKDGYAILRGDVKERLPPSRPRMRPLRRLGNWSPPPPSMWSGFAAPRAAPAVNGAGFDRRQAAPRFLGFFCPRLSCRAATRSITLLPAGLGGGVGVSVPSPCLRSAFSRPRCRCRDIWRDRILPPCPRSASGQD